MNLTKNKKLTICFIGTTESIHMLKWTKYFADKGHKVHLISYAPLLKNYDLGDIKLHFLKKRIPIEVWPFNTLLNFPFNLSRVKKLIKKIKPDIVSAHYVTAYGHLAVLSGFRPLVVTAWGSDILVAPKESLIARQVVKYVLKKADLITCDADHIKEAMIKLGASPSKIKIINFGIDTEKFSPGQKDESLKKEWNISNEKVIISLRNLGPGYDIITLIKAVPLVLKEFSSAKFIIAGKGPQEKELKNLAEELGVINSVQFIGWISNEELLKYLRTADVYVSTSLSDGGIASSTAEAMACGLPVVITDVGDNKKWVKDGESGFLIPLKNPEVLAEKIIFLLKNKDAGRKMGMAARKIIEEKNNYFREMEKMEQLYKIINKISL